MRGLTCKRVQCDEIRSVIYSKAKNVAKAKGAPEGAGDVWTWTVIDADNKLAISWMVGGRDSEYAKAFMQDVGDRLANRVQLTTDGHRPYLEAVESAFGNAIDYAQLNKVYGTPPEGEKRYGPPQCIGARKYPVVGRPAKEHASTSHVERQNLTMRMHMRRFTRLTNAFSKKLKNHSHAVALHFMFYNFVRIHKTLEGSPAMAAGVTDRLWELEDIVALIDADEPPPKKRGPYKKRATQAEISNRGTTAAP